jgi:hypothetical protein
LLREELMRLTQELEELKSKEEEDVVKARSPS